MGDEVLRADCNAEFVEDPFKDDVDSTGVGVLDKGAANSDVAVAGAVVVESDDVDGVLFNILPVDSLYCGRPANGDVET